MIDENVEETKYPCNAFGNEIPVIDADTVSHMSHEKTPSKNIDLEKLNYTGKNNVVFKL